jgi:hypothetical protein
MEDSKCTMTITMTAWMATNQRLASGAGFFGRSQSEQTVSAESMRRSR